MLELSLIELLIVDDCVVDKGLALEVGGEGIELDEQQPSAVCSYIAENQV